MYSIIVSLLYGALCLTSNFDISMAESYPCGRFSVSSGGQSSIQGPSSLPKSNLETSLDPILISVNWIYDNLQPRTDIFENVVQNISLSISEIQANPIGSTSLRLITYYAGYVAVACGILFIAAIWPLVGLFFCCCRCCCHRCCYGHRGDIYSTTRKTNGSCRRCGCGFLFFFILLVVMGACMGCFISAVIFRLNVTSSTSLDAAAEATSSAYNNNNNNNNNRESTASSSSLVVTEHLGASTLDVIDSLRALGNTYAHILRRHVTELTDSMMGGVQDLVKRLSIYLDNDWLGGANATLDTTKVLQQNISAFIGDLTQLMKRHEETSQLVDMCVFNAQELKSNIKSACKETESRECSSDLQQQLNDLDVKVAALKKLFDSFVPIDGERVRSLERQRVGDKATEVLNVYASDLDKIQNEAFQIAGGSSVRQSIFVTLNSSLGTASDLLLTRTNQLAAQASNHVASMVCNNNENPPFIAKYVGPTLNYTFYGLMGVASLIALLVLFMGLAMLAACAGRSYYKRASCFAISAISISFFFATVLAVCCLGVFLATALTHSEVCRPIARQDSLMFKPLDEYVTTVLGNVGDSEHGEHWPPELIFASSSSAKASLTGPWSFSFGDTLSSCLHKNASLMAALQLHLPHSRLADRLIASIRSHLKEATDDAVMKIKSKLDGVDLPASHLQDSLKELMSLQLGDWQLPHYPSQNDMIYVGSESTVSRLTYAVANEIRSDSALIVSLKTFELNCQQNLFGEQLPWLMRTATSIESQSKVINRMAVNLTQKVDAITSKIAGGSDSFRKALMAASEDLGNYLELTARKKLAEFETILATDEAGRCHEAASRIITASEVVCRPLGVLSVFSLLLLIVVLVAIPLILCIGAPFGQSLRWPSTPIIPGLNPQSMNHAPGFEGLPLLDLLPRYQKIG